MAPLHSVFGRVERAVLQIPRGELTPLHGYFPLSNPQDERSTWILFNNSRVAETKNMTRYDCTDEFILYFMDRAKTEIRSCFCLVGRIALAPTLRLLLLYKLSTEAPLI